MFESFLGQSQTKVISNVSGGAGVRYVRFSSGSAVPNRGAVQPGPQHNKGGAKSRPNLLKSSHAVEYSVISVETTNDRGCYGHKRNYAVRYTRPRRLSKRRPPKRPTSRRSLPLYQHHDNGPKARANSLREPDLTQSRGPEPQIHSLPGPVGPIGNRVCLSLFAVRWIRGGSRTGAHTNGDHGAGDVGR
ncbi:hypothetical protein CPLU01_15465 [Colletotrichum plurivorum]|uniref:Uncharacterized protein n=1 Tax=Colletotrichum plurivorum TaxID=2175906 RepID=A0A8H6JAP5_9PEZI|nr:hypothetical protein CPLU01_15465 [Colletotrichum plurivorum]